jgi:hypothetical protein
MKQRTRKLLKDLVGRIVALAVCIALVTTSLESILRGAGPWTGR